MLQHPTSYTKYGMQDRETLGFDVRNWKIIGTPEDHGSYVDAPVWSMRASDVVAGGLENYVANVKKWD